MSGRKNVRVTTLNGEKLELSIQPNTTGQQVFNQVVKALGIGEIWYFGLQYIDSKGVTSWLRLNRAVLAQDVNKEEPLRLKLRAKFYPEHVSELIQVVTQRMFFLQVKDAILSDEIYCPPEIAVLLSSYACQAKYGDLSSNSLWQDNINFDRLLPERVYNQHTLTKNEWASKIKGLWSERKGTLQEDSILEYLKIAQDLDMYGINYFEIKNKNDTNLYLGWGSLGLNVYGLVDKLNPVIGFSWHEMRNISFKKKKFVIKLTDQKAPNLVCYASLMRINKLMLALCLGNHELYMRRRKPDTLEVQEMKAQAREEKLTRQQASAELSLITAQRLDAERAKMKLEKNLKLYEEEKEKAKHANQGVASEIVEKVNEAIALTEQLNEEMRKAEILKAKQEIIEMKMLKQTKALETEQTVVVCGNELQSGKLPEYVSEDVSEEVQEFGTDLGNSAGVVDYDHDLESMEKGKNESILAMLGKLTADLSKTRDEATTLSEDKIHSENVKEGRDKYKTLKQIRQGNTKTRVDAFESW